jgi:hypothetical protein
MKKVTIKELKEQGIIAGAPTNKVVSTSKGPEEEAAGGKWQRERENANDIVAVPGLAAERVNMNDPAVKALMDKMRK